jgi:hypothetical protein
MKERLIGTIAVAMGCVLAAAWISKVFAPHYAPELPVFGWEIPMPIRSLAAGIELSLAILLIVFRRNRVVLLVGAGLFLVYAIVAYDMMSRGFDACGCFGKIMVDPVAVFSFDIVAVLLLAAAVCLVSGPGKGWSSVVMVCVSSVTMCVGMLGYMVSRDAVIRMRESEYRSLVAIDGRLSRDRWLVVFYRSTCPECLEHKKEWTRDMEDRVGQPYRFALVNLGPDERDVVFGDYVLGNQIRIPWQNDFMETPVLVIMSVGTVIGRYRSWNEAMKVVDARNILERRYVPEWALDSGVYGDAYKNAPAPIPWSEPKVNWGAMGIPLGVVMLMHAALFIVLRRRRGKNI